VTDQPPNSPQSAWVRTNPGEAVLQGVNWGGLKTLYIKEVRRFFKVQLQTVWAPAVTTMLYLVIFTVGATSSPGQYRPGVQMRMPVVVTASHS
jgi:ABC-2 type transport system permease protein